MNDTEKIKHFILSDQINCEFKYMRALWELVYYSILIAIYNEIPNYIKMENIDDFSRSKDGEDNDISLL